jgi:hypothetical protein
MTQAGVAAILGNVCNLTPKTNITDIRIALAAVLMTETGIEVHTNLVIDPVVDRGAVTTPLAVDPRVDVIPVAHSAELTLKRKKQSLILSFGPLLRR